jgi:thymidylate synthase (FAD)
MTVEITTSRAIAAQILRHRSFSFQEFSQRYSEAPGVEEVELRQQAKKNRQSSSEIIPKRGFADLILRQAIAASQKAYQDLLEAGVARECARMVLPLATSTTLYMTGSVRSWIHYLAQRLDQHTQKEHRLIAEQVQEIFSTQFPVVSQALNKHENR